MKNSLYLLFVIIFLASCSKQPVASFTANETSIKEGETITFINTSAEALTYLWEFGDGITSTEESPSHIYSTKGTYKATLTAYSKKEKKKSQQSLEILVSKSPYNFKGTITGGSGSSNVFFEVDDINYTLSTPNEPGSILVSKIGKTGPNYPNISINRGYVYANSVGQPTNDEFDNGLWLSEYQYSVGPWDGVEIVYVDETGKEWSTSNGIPFQFQTGIYFKFSSKTTKSNYAGEHIMEYTASFSCNVADSTGTSLSISGSMFGFFANR